jgi:hypothetical protein
MDDGTDGWKGGPTPTNTAGQTDTTNIIMVEMGRVGKNKLQNLDVRNISARLH